MNDDDDRKIISFPGGEKLDDEDTSAGYVLDSVAGGPVAELLDSYGIDRETRERIKYVEKQELTKVVKNGGSTTQIIDILITEIAEELAHLKFKRRKAFQDGGDVRSFTGSRMRHLRSLTELLFKKKESAMAEQLDLRSPRLQKIFKVWMEFFYSSMEKCGISEEMVDLVFQQMKADMKDWESKIDTL